MRSIGSTIKNGWTNGTLLRDGEWSWPSASSSSNVLAGTEKKQPHIWKPCGELIITSVFRRVFLRSTSLGPEPSPTSFCPAGALLRPAPPHHLSTYASLSSDSWPFSDCPASRLVCHHLQADGHQRSLHPTGRSIHLQEARKDRPWCTIGR